MRQLKYRPHLFHMQRSIIADTNDGLSGLDFVKITAAVLNPMECRNSAPYLSI